MPIKFRPKKRQEGEIIPEGLSITETWVSINLYIRRADEIARIRILKATGETTYEVRTRES